MVDRRNAAVLLIWAATFVVSVWSTPANQLTQPRVWYSLFIGATAAVGVPIMVYYLAQLGIERLAEVSGGRSQ